jgi:hypothetical protein
MVDIEHKMEVKWKKLNDDSRKYPTRNEKCRRASNFVAVVCSPQLHNGGSVTAFFRMFALQAAHA